MGTEFSTHEMAEVVPTGGRRAAGGEPTFAAYHATLIQ